MNILDNGKNYKKAFNCKKCPCSNSTDGCPMWWEYIQNNSVDGTSRVVKECGYTALPTFLTAVISASNRPAESIDYMRKEVIAGLSGIAASANIIYKNTLEPSSSQNTSNKELKGVQDK